MSPALVNLVLFILVIIILFIFMTIKHPDYPDIDFKPALALLDWDQTYDLAAFRYKFDTNYLDLPLITSNLYLCDRYTPDNIPWAENWGLLVFELNKRLNYYKFLFGSTFTKISSIP